MKVELEANKKDIAVAVIFGVFFLLYKFGDKLVFLTDMMVNGGAPS